ncbi:hypothetical protein QTP88_017056 [Uroleucon formosanum]
MKKAFRYEKHIVCKHNEIEKDGGVRLCALQAGNESARNNDSVYAYTYIDDNGSTAWGGGGGGSEGKPAVVFELAPSARKINEARNDPLYRTRYYWRRNEIEIYRKQDSITSSTTTVNLTTILMYKMVSRNNDRRRRGRDRGFDGGGFVVGGGGGGGGDVGGNRGVQGGRKHPRVQAEGRCSRRAKRCEERGCVEGSNKLYPLASLYSFHPPLPPPSTPPSLPPPSGYRSVLREL